MEDKLSTLKSVFGYTSFRQGQEEIIDALLAGRDAVGIMPTGAGKSICFQIPALLLDGISLIVSPLISLMKDQVNALTQAGIPAAYINSSLTGAQIGRVLENARNGDYKIIYIAPERLDTEAFLWLAKSMTIPFVAVDEAHCVSQWGQDFRPSYLRIPEFIDTLPTRPVLGAFTATATGRVREDIVKLLGLADPCEVTTGFDRVNLSFEVKSPKSKFSALEDFLRAQGDKSGIVYCQTRKTVEDVCRKILGLGYAATQYHAGLSDRERHENQEDFQTDKATVMVATNAFGMGIDKSNVAFVVHYNMPKNMESYYQEAGRAGRDGSPARCLLLYSGQDVVTNQFFIEKANENGEMEPEALERFKQVERERLKQMTFYCFTHDCLRAYILRYFGEKPPNFCGNCFNCTHHFEEADITVEAQKILSCVKRMGEKYGVKLVCDTLRGLENDKTSRLGLCSLSTFGIMKEVSERRLREMLNFLVMGDFLSQSDGEYPTLRLGPRARQVLFEGLTLTMRIGKEEAPRPKKQERERIRSRDKEINVNPRLFDKLRDLRGELARAQRVPAYVIFPDAALRDMCEKMPRSPAEMLQVSGVGHAKMARYGEAFLELIRGEADEAAFAAPLDD